MKEPKELVGILVCSRVFEQEYRIKHVYRPLHSGMFCDLVISVGYLPFVAGGYDEVVRKLDAGYASLLAATWVRLQDGMRERYYQLSKDVHPLNVGLGHGWTLYARGGRKGLSDMPYRNKGGGRCQ